MSIDPQASFKNGMNEVFSPNLKDGETPSASIIFIHGLFGHPWKTWADEAAVGPKKPFWPRDLLPTTVHNARIFSFGYDANVEKFMGSASLNTVLDHGTNLLNDLAALLDKERIPLIFVVHSLGGLVLKEALNQSASTQHQRKRDVIKFVHGIIFLGTPHKGSNAASYGKMAFRLTKLFAGQSANTKLLQSLEKDSDVLDRVSRAFYETWAMYEKLQISSFHEEKEISRLGLFRMRIVPPECARIGHIKEDLGSIPADHRYMAKFQNVTDVGFTRVSNIILRWMSEIKDELSQLDFQDYQDCLNSLDDPLSRARMHQVLPEHHGTFEWLFSDKVSFSKWLADDQGEHSPIFWMTGKPGSGKTTCMRFAMQDSRLLKLLPEARGYPMAYFFHLRGKDIVQKSLRGMLLELLHQVLRQFPVFFECIKDVYRGLVLHQRKQQPEWDVSTLKNCLSMLSIIKHSKSKGRLRFVFFLDALDENADANENSEVLSFVQDLSRSFALYPESRHLLKICLASRPWPLFKKRLGDDPRILSFAIHNFTSRDIDIYTNSHLTAAFSESGTTAMVQQDVQSITDMVTKKAHGVFIWVGVVVKELCRHIVDGSPNEELVGYVAGLPDELGALYEYTMMRIPEDYALETLVACQILHCSLSQMTLEMLYHATHSCIRGTTGSISRDIHAWLMSRTGGLIEAIPFAQEVTARDSPNIQFIHQTAQEFVRNDMPGLRLTNMAKVWSLLDGNFFIYLATSSFRNPSQSLKPLTADTFRYLRTIGERIDEDLSRTKKSQTLDAINNLSEYLSFTWQGSGQPFYHRGFTCTLEELKALMTPGDFHVFSKTANSLSPHNLTRPETEIRGYLVSVFYDLYHCMPSLHFAFDRYPNYSKKVLWFAALGPRSMETTRTDRVRMVEMVIDVLPYAFTPNPRDSGPLHSIYFDEISMLLGRRPPFLSFLGRNVWLTNAIIMIEDHDYVDEGSRLELAEYLLSRNNFLDEYDFDFEFEDSLDSLLVSTRMSPREFCRRFKSRQWVSLIERYDRNNYRNTTTTGPTIRNLDVNRVDAYSGITNILNRPLLMGGLLAGSITFPRIESVCWGPFRNSSSNLAASSESHLPLENHSTK